MTGLNCGCQGPCSVSEVAESEDTLLRARAHAPGTSTGHLAQDRVGRAPRARGDSDVDQSNQATPRTFSAKDAAILGDRPTVGAIVRDGDVWRVRSVTRDATYFVRLTPSPRCTCPDARLRRHQCKHILAVQSLNSLVCPLTPYG
jgi:hypothetical protein